MTKKFIPLLFASVLLASCKGGTPAEKQIVKIVSPLGAPSVAFYDQGKNENWVSEAAANLPAELQGSEYDVVVFDSITGLSSIKAKNLDFALAKVITGGNFHLMGVNTTKLPTDDSVIVAFQKDKVPDKVFKKLALEKWGLSESMHVEYVAGDVSQTAAVLKTGKFQGHTVDYVLSAEPVITQAKTSLDEGITLNEIYNVRNEWKAYSGQDAIVQAGVFVRKSSISSKKAELSDFMRLLEQRLDSLTKDGLEAATAMNEYSSDLEVQKNRFGANSNLVKNLQANGKNRLGFVSTEEKINVNAFLTTLDESVFSNDYFVTL